MNRGFYSEQILPSVGASLALISLAIATSFTLWAALGNFAAAGLLITSLIFIALWWQRAIHKITIDKDFLYVNQAKIEREYLGTVKVLERESWLISRGMKFDPRAFHAHKFWMKSGVEIEILDSRDPHPHWLIGSKRPQELRDALAKN
jgi:hypothetical protein